MRRPIAGESLSVRARNAIDMAINGYRPPGADVSTPVIDTDKLTRTGLRRALEAKRRDTRWTTVQQMLLVVKNCGHLTVREIMTWIGMSHAVAPHVCVCRTCGRHYGHSTGDRAP